MPTTAETGYAQRPKWPTTAAVLGYVAIVLGVDMLASHAIRLGIDWRVFCWYVHSFDLFKFMAWFMIPFLFSLRGMDWGYFGVKRWRRVDVLILAGMAVLGLLAVLIIPLFPSLRAVYQSSASLPWAARWMVAGQSLVWTLSWLMGWEFLHRYVLLRQVSARWPRFGWLIVPLSEGLYHLQKPPLEALGMVVFSLILTPWALRRKNMLLPFLVHFFIEASLIIFLAVV